MWTSGTTALATSGAGSVSLVTLPAGGTYNRLVITNEGGVAGFASIDGGATWARVAANGVSVFPGRSNKAPLMKRDSSDMSGIYAFVDEAYS